MIPPYDAIVLARPGLATESPEILEALSQLEGRIDEERMQALNYEVDMGGRTPAGVARDFLEGLSKSP